MQKQIGVLILDMKWGSKKEFEEKTKTLLKIDGTSPVKDAYFKVSEQGTP